MLHSGEGIKRVVMKYRRHKTRGGDDEVLVLVLPEVLLPVVVGVDVSMVAGHEL